MFEKCEKIMNCQTFICRSNLCLVEYVSIFLLHKIIGLSFYFWAGKASFAISKKAIQSTSGFQFF